MLNEADAYNALRDMVQGYTSHELADALIDRLGLSASRDAVAAHIRKGLNPNETECLRNIETLVIEQHTGRHSWLEFHATALGREIPELLRPDQAYLRAIEQADRLDGQARHWRAEAARIGESLDCRKPRLIFVPAPGARFAVR